MTMTDNMDNSSALEDAKLDRIHQIQILAENRTTLPPALQLQGKSNYNNWSRNFKFWFKNYGSPHGEEYVTNGAIPEFSDPAKQGHAQQYLETAVDVCIMKTVCEEICREVIKSCNRGYSSIKFIEEEYGKLTDEDLINGLRVLSTARDLTPTIDDSLDKMEEVLDMMGSAFPESKEMLVKLVIASLNCPELEAHIKRHQIDLPFEGLIFQLKKLMEGITIYTPPAPSAGNSNPTQKLPRCSRCKVKGHWASICTSPHPSHRFSSRSKQPTLDPWG